MQREPYQWAIVGPSGRGKTYSFRNLDPKTTGFINLEWKPLPFTNKFEYYKKPNTWSEAYDVLVEFAKNDKIKTVVMESFSAYSDSLLKHSRQVKKGFDIYSYYNEMIGNLLYLIKRYPKDLLITAHVEMVNTEEGVVERRVAVEGQQWKGKVEKDFTVVAYAGVEQTEKSREYLLYLSSDGKTSAKTPPDLLETLGGDKVGNDANELIKALDKAFNKNN